MNGHITSCGCRKSSSHEDKIRLLLHDLDISFVEQYRFPDCKYKYTLPFDFAVFNNGTLSFLIEYDGKQHFTPLRCFGGLDGYDGTHKRDMIKDQYCQTNNIHLLRLPYTLTDDEIKEKIINTIYP